MSASSSHKAQASHLLLYATPEHECSYLPDREAITVFADPEYPKDVALQGMLTEKGFRRSGTHVYRPNCPSCNACEAARVSVMAFKPNRSQRRTWQRNLDLDVSVGHQRFEQEHYDLYAHYVTTRHAGGGMDDPTPDKYQDFLFCSWAETRLIEFRCEEQLLAVAVTDQLPGALSAVYTFFDPEHAARGLGVYAVLWQIETARRTGLDWLYLGFAIDDCAKMRYKRDFGPQQRLRDEQWADT